MQQKSSGGMPMKRLIALIALVVLAVAVIVFAVREIRLYGDVQAEQSRTNPELANYFVIYRFRMDEPVDLSDPSKIVEITRNTWYKLPYEHGREKFRYVVTAVDRFHNENLGKVKKVKL